MTHLPHLSSTTALVEEIEHLEACRMLAWGEDGDRVQRIEQAIESRRDELKAAASRMLGCDVKRAAVAMGGFV